MFLALGSFISNAALAPKLMVLLLKLFELAKEGIEAANALGSEATEDEKIQQSADVFIAGYKALDSVGNFSDEIDAFVCEDMAKPFIKIVYKFMKRFIWGGL